MFLIPEFDAEAMLNAARARHAAAVALLKHPGLFIGASLGAWIPRVLAAGVPVVPVSQIATIRREAFLDTADGGDQARATMEPLRAALAALDGTQMARFDPCSGIELKMSLADGRTPSQADRQDLLGFDPRAFDIIAEYPADEVPVWSRPWVQAKMVDGYPVEFRAFVENGEVKGIASYYPQRPLQLTPDISIHVTDCLGMAFKIIDHLESINELPWMPGYEGRFDRRRVSATLDFIVGEDGKVLFLEAGPPFGAGTHPCAFIDQPIKGVALALAPGVKLR